MHGLLGLTRPTADPEVWAVGGHPADAAMVGLCSGCAATQPDLVASGINNGNSVSSAAFHSRTVAAAITAAELGVPAIAVSGPSARQPDTSPAHFAAAADFAARLVTALATRAGGGRCCHRS
ncbi:5'/3'-nucleotidase SurE [Amycolatopsis jejuensis]|uniref:5'/3'-nucleotidase SurE n=1 Tax=Amycolatopsis jejuensis TaxID=330084 RepID=UPI00068DBA73|nr:5'/3'-nucleotidase SurE [Amycolatopsis jejuensis]